MNRRSSTVAITDHTNQPLDIERRIFLGSDWKLLVPRDRLKSQDELISFAKHANAVIYSADVRFSGLIMDEIPNLKIISLASIGADSIDIQAATKRGILVTNVPDYCLDEVADHTMALILSQMRGLFLMAKALGSGKWGHDVHELVRVRRLSSQVLGLLAFGKTARRVAVRAKAFGFKIISYDPYVPRWEFDLLGVEKVDTIDELFRRSDIISAHLPLNRETRHLVGEKEIGQMKRTARFVNAGRGATVDERALIAALEEKRIAGAALDVLEHEPIGMNNRLLQLDDVVLTPHLAAYSEEAFIAVREDACRAVLDALSGHRPRFLLNPKAFKK